jgi:hypothetical protein
MPESKQYHYSKDGNEYDVVVYEGEYGKENGDGYGHNIRTETTVTDEYGHTRVTHEDIYGHTVYSDVKSSDGSHVQKYEDATGRWWMESYDSNGHGYRQTIDEWDGSDYPDDSNENVGNWRNPEPDEEPIGLVTQGQGEEPSPYDGIEDKNYAEDYLNPYSPDGQENYAQDHLPSPDTGIQGVENHAAGHLPGPLVEPNPPAPDPEQEAEERARAEEELGPQTPSSPTPEDLGIQERYGNDLNVPDLVEEPAPAPPVPGPEVQVNYAKDYGFPGLVGEPPADPYPPAVPGGGELPDGNANGIPGEYGDGPDLDANGIPDEIGINPDSLQPGYPNPSTLGEWGGVGVPDPTVVPQSDAATTSAEAMPEEYGGGSALDGNWVPEETAIDPYYAFQQPAYADPSTSGDGAWDPYAGSSFEPYVPPEEAPPEEEAPAVAEGEDPDALGSF